MFLGSFQGQVSSGSETSDRHILPGLLPQLECAPRPPVRWIACLLEKFPSNNKFGEVSERNAVSTPEVPDGKLSHRVSIPRWIAVLLGLFVWFVALPLVHGVIPWAISLLTPRYGWTEGWPGVWNLPGLIPVIVGAAGLIWILVTALRIWLRCLRGWSWDGLPRIC